VLQSVYSSTVSEAAARSTLYVMALSSSLVAMGFLSQSRELFLPFGATVLPVVFLLGLFTVIRLVDTGLESMHYLVALHAFVASIERLGRKRPSISPPSKVAGRRWNRQRFDLVCCPHFWARRPA